MDHRVSRDRPSLDAPRRGGGFRAAGALCVGAACAAFLTAGCSPKPSAPRSYPTLTPTQRAERSEIDHESYETLGYRVVWRAFPSLGRGQAVGDFDIFGERIVVRDTANTVTLIESATGRNRWSVTLASPVTRFVGNATADGRLLVCTDNEVYVLDIQTGEILDRQSLALVVNTAPAVVGDIAVFGAVSGEVLGHSLYQGFRRWGYLLDGAIEADPTVVDGSVGVVSRNGDVIVLDPATGSAINRQKIFGGSAEKPVGGQGVLYIASLDQSLYAIDADAPGTLWRKRHERPLRERPTLHAGVLYASIPERGLHAYDAITGELLWVNSGVFGRVIGRRADALLVWSGGEMIRLDPDTGDEFDRVWLPGITEAALGSFEDGALFTVSQTGVVAKFVPIR